MPYSLTFALATRDAPALPQNAVPALHANFFSWLQLVDADLAQRIDSGEGAKPFTVSPLSQRNGRASFRVTLLDDNLFPLLSTGIGKRPEVRILHAVLPLEREPLTAYHSYADLAQCARQDKALSLRFDSPTSFRSNEKHYPFPDPVLVFTSYLTRWNAFATDWLIDESWLEWLRAAVAPSRFQLRSETVRFPHFYQVGCVGSVEYRAVAEVDDDQALQVWNALADYAYYCGTGHKTTQGMGQTIRLDQWGG